MIDRKTIRFSVALLLTPLSLTIVLSSLSTTRTLADVASPERLNLGTGGTEANNDSYYAFLSQDARYVTFESYASNWAADQNGNDNCFGNCVDIFVRDRLVNVTTKVSVGYNGSPTDEDSFHPMITADGRYVVYTSYATNLVLSDTNRSAWSRDGLDVFLYDRLTDQNQRVTLDWTGSQIDGNSVGTASGDGTYIVFASNGRNIIQNEDNGQFVTNIYLRDWRTGAIQRITRDVFTGGYPNGLVSDPQINFDGRYVVFASDATNLTNDVSNGLEHVFLYDRVSDETRVISKGYDGSIANGPSSKAQISADGNTIAFKSEATNLVSGDTNGWADIFIYSVDTGVITRINVADDGEQANGFSKEPSICGDGSVVSFNSDATNLVPGDVNGYRDVFFRDLNRGRTAVATINGNGVWGNGKSHRSYVAPDCHSIAYATDADNAIPNDGNHARDLYVADITWPPDFSASSQYAFALADPGDLISYTFVLSNTGTQAAAVTFTDPIPANTSFAPGSERGGLTFNLSQNLVMWSGTILGESQHVVGFSVFVDSTLTGFTLLDNQATIIGGGNQYDLRAITTVNGFPIFLPLVAKE